MRVIDMRCWVSPSVLLALKAITSVGRDVTCLLKEIFSRKGNINMVIRSLNMKSDDIHLSKI